jgi:zinc protease
MAWRHAGGFDPRTGEETGTVKDPRRRTFSSAGSQPGINRRQVLSRGALLLGAAVPTLGLSAAPARSETLDEDKIKETVFPNGLKLVVKESRASDLACVQVWIRAGGFLEDENTAGTAHVIEHLVFKGSEISDPGSIDAEIENLGGLLEAATDKDWTRFSCTVAGRYVGKVLQVIADTVRKPRLRIEDWEAEKPVIREEIEQIRLNPDAALQKILFQLAFQKHPYRNDVRGTTEFLNGLDIAAVRAHYKKYYVPSAMTVVVVGDVDPAGVERATRAAFQADQGSKTPAPPLPPEEKPCQRADRRVLNSIYLSGYVGIAYPAPSVKDLPDTHAMDILLTTLEHSGIGRLPRALRGAGAVRAGYETRRQAGLMTVIAGTGRTETEQVEAVLRREIDFAVNRGIPPDEVELAKRILRGSYALDNEPYSGQSGTLGYYDSIDRWQFAADYLQKVEAVTPAQVNEVASKYLAADHSVSVLFRPRAAGPPQPPRSGA